MQQGKIPLVVEAHSADIIATLIALKAEIESKSSISLQLTITGATEAHLLAKELGEAGVGVIFVPSRPFPKVWEMKRLCVHFSVFFLGGGRANGGLAVLTYISL